MGEGGKRIGCCVPFCQQTRGDRKNDPLPFDLEGFEWICFYHWRMVNPIWRRRYRLFKRREDHEAICKMWKRCKSQAIERAAGL